MVPIRWSEVSGTDGGALGGEGGVVVELTELKEDVKEEKEIDTVETNKVGPIRWGY